MGNKILRVLLFSICILSISSIAVWAQADASTVRELYQRGMAEQSKENLYLSIELYKMALEISPAYLNPMKGLAEAYFMLGEYKEALRWCVEALRFDRNNLELKVLEARIFIGLSEYVTAEEIFREVLIVEPYNFDAQFGLAELDVARGRTLQAQIWYEKAMDLQPQNRRAILSLALVYDDRNELEKAEELIKLALHYYPSNHIVQYLAAKLYLKLGDLSRAEMHVKKALALKTSFPDAAMLLSSIYLHQGNYQNVVDSLEDIVNENQNNHLLWYTLGFAYEKTGKTAKSINAYSRAFRIRPDDEMSRIAIEDLVMNQFDFDAPERIRYADYHFKKGMELENRYFFDQALVEYRRGLFLAPFAEKGRKAYAGIFKAFGYYNKYLSELLVLKDEGYDDRFVLDEIEIYTSILDETVSKSWNIRQYPGPIHTTDSDALLLDQSNNKFKVLMFYDPEKMLTDHPLSEEKVAKYFFNHLFFEDKVNLLDQAKKYAGFSDAFRLARNVNSDFFIVFSFRENVRAFSAECDLYNSATGNVLRSYRVFRTGNDKVKNSLTKLASYINADLPHRGQLINKRFDMALINLGSRDDIEKDMQFHIVQGPYVDVSPDTLEFIYPDESILGTFTVSETDELVAEGSIETLLFFDLINPGDWVIPIEQVEEEPLELEEEEKRKKEDIEGEEIDEDGKSGNLDLYREILKVQ